MSKAKDRVREALTAGSNVKERGPPAADGILSITPDTPEMLEWRSRSALDVAEALDDDDYGPKPHELYGKFTWKIENFSEISRRELRSNVFDVGNYKWYILVYPQGCDVCNHLSLFLCVADYDKLLPGWSHFAQFTIAVVNKDPKKSKYSDTLHRFCKKEHDWGWKKFMELSKVLDGFTVADTLVIKAQVQVILDKPSRPFRCLDPQYRRELVRVYLTNVENICRRFCEDKRARLAWARDSASFRQFWGGLGAEQQRRLLTERGDVLLKAVVKQFFNEKEVTSTLVMDALYSGCKQIEEHSRSWFEGKCPADGAPLVAIRAERNTFTLCGDLGDIAQRVQQDFLPPPKDDGKALQPNDGLTLRSGQEGDADYRRDSLERDERRLAELGRRTLEVFVVAHVFCDKLEIAYREAEALKRQDQLIAEEVELARLEESKAQAKAAADKEKRAKKKEKLKARKAAEKLRREAEEAERQARDEEHRRQEAERKAKEAERRKLEDAASPPQPHRKARKDERRAAQQAAKARQLQTAQLQLQQQQEAVAAPSTARTTAGVSTSGGGRSSAHAEELPPESASTQQPEPVAVCTGAEAGPGERQEGSDCGGGAGWVPSLSALAAAAVPSPSSVVAAGPGSSGASVGAGAGEQEDPPSESGSGASASEEPEAVNHGDAEAVGSSGDTEDEAAGRYGGREDATGWCADGGLGATGRAFGGPLEEEVVYLRAQVAHLQQRLAARDAEVYALRARLRELQGAPAEVAAAPGAGPGPGTGRAGEEGGLSVGAPGRCSNSSSTNFLLGALENGLGAAAVPAGSRSGRGSGSGDGTSGSGSGGEGGPGTANGGHALLAHAPGLSAALIAARSSAHAATGAGAGGGARGDPAGSINGGGLGMQRSTSATLPGASANGSSVTAAVSNAAAFVHLAANGRPRPQEGAAAGSRGGGDGSGTAAAASTATPAKGGTTFTAASLSNSSSTAATANGTGGVVHRTAAAAAGAGTAAAGISAAAAGTSMSGSLGPSHANGTHASSGSGKQRPEEGGSSSSGFGGSPRALMQAAQARGLAGFGAATPVSSSSKRSAPTAQLDSPGLEDFAHINMIDDLLTE